MNILGRIERIDDLGHIDGCSEEQLKEAEKVLGLRLPTEYVDYVKTYGCIDFGSTEWTGLNIEGELNTVESTITERRHSKNFPRDCFVLEDCHIDGKKIVVNKEGKVFLLQYGAVSKVCNSISEYLEVCVKNNK